MSWEREPLWTKARLYFERAFSQRHDDELFGLWCSLGIELLARAAIASVSPALLAEPDRDHKSLLHVFGRGSDRTPPKSIATVQALTLCQTLFPEFTENDFKTSVALVNRRNEELHTGASAFTSYPSKQWVPNFYRACKALCSSMGESLDTLFGETEAQAASGMLEDIQNDVKQKVNSSIAAHRKVFEGKTPVEQSVAAKAAMEEGNELAYRRHHRVVCPSCNSTATVQGEEVGPERSEITDDGIEIRQAISPRSFSCSACGLKLNGYSELDVAGLGGNYTRTTLMSPEDYYGLVNLEEMDAGAFVEQFLRENPGYFQEYDNE